jgi:hypothetical protein
MTKFITINNEAYVNIDFIDHNAINAYVERTTEGTFLLLSDVIKNMTTFEFETMLFRFEEHDGLESFTLILFSEGCVYFNDICNLMNVFVEKPQIRIDGTVASCPYGDSAELATNLHFDSI